MRIFLSVFVGLLVSTSSTLTFADAKVGGKAPSFELPGHDGKTYNLEKLKGQWVVLEWFNEDCPYVEKHYDDDHSNMQKLQKKWIAEGKKHGGLSWFAVISSAPGKQGHMTAEKAAEFIKEEKAHMSAILLDPSGSVGKAYGAKTTPHMYIINPEGTLVYNGAIDDKPSTKTSSLKGATNYVSQALTEAFSGAEVSVASTKPYGCSVKY